MSFLNNYLFKTESFDYKAITAFYEDVKIYYPSATITWKVGNKITTSTNHANAVIIEKHEPDDKFFSQNKNMGNLNFDLMNEEEKERVLNSFIKAGISPKKPDYTFGLLGIAGYLVAIFLLFTTEFLDEKYIFIFSILIPFMLVMLGLWFAVVYTSKKQTITNIVQVLTLISIIPLAVLSLLCLPFFQAVQQQKLFNILKNRK